MDLAAIFQADKQVRIFRVVVFLITLALAVYSFTAYADDIRVSDKIYSNLERNHYCSRRLNGTHQMGCTSELGGNTGVLWVVANDSDIKHVLESGPTPPYIVAMKGLYQTTKNILKFKEHHDRVAGVVFINDSIPTESHTPEDSCPNRYSGLYSNNSEFQNCKTNTWLESSLSGLMYEDIPFPIFLIKDPNSIADLDKCFSLNHKEFKQNSYPLCGMQLDSFMLAAGDTQNCLNSASMIDDILPSSNRRCGWVERNNIFAFLKPSYSAPTIRNDDGKKHYFPEVVDPHSIVMLVAKSSSLSMFSDVSPGADSTITPIVTLLAVAEALGRYRNDTESLESRRNLVFTLFDSEPFDYTGSTAFVRMMEKKQIPQAEVAKDQPTINNIDLESIDFVINLDQLANYSNRSKLILHLDPSSDNRDKISKLENVFSSKDGIDVKIEQKLPLPPTSVHQFIKSTEKLPGEKLLGSVLSNYDAKFVNRFYHSIYDDSNNVQYVGENKAYLVDHIVRVSSLVASSLYELVFEKAKRIETSPETVRNLLDCYLENGNCTTFIRALPAGLSLAPGPIQTYWDPTKHDDNINSVVTQALLRYFLGDRFEYNHTKCNAEDGESQQYNFVYVNGKDKPITDGTQGVCIRSQVIALNAISPAYSRIDNMISVNKSLPAWTVSLDNIRNPVRIFMIPSPVYQWCVLLLGIIVTLMSFAIVHHLKATMADIKGSSELRRAAST